jgi:hypothetical protein
MKKIIRLTESDLMKLVKRVIRENENSELQNLKNDENIIFLKEKEDSNNEFVFKIGSVDNMYVRKGFDKSERDQFERDDMEWTFKGVIIGRILDGKIKIKHNPIPTTIIIDLTDAFPKGIKHQYDYSLVTIYEKSGMGYTEYEVDDEDMDKILEKSLKNDKGGVFNKMSRDMGDFEGMGSMFESKMYRRKHRR